MYKLTYTQPMPDIAIIHLPSIDLKQVDILDSQEQHRAQQFKFDRHRDAFIASHIALRLKLAEYLSIPPQEINYLQESKGKPYIKNHPCHFNLSHAGDYALIGLSENPIGVDIEKITNRNNIELAKRFFHPDEVAWLVSQPKQAQQMAFFTLWTRKEAVVKYLGTGIANTLNQFDATQSHCLINNMRCQINNINAPRGYQAAYAH